MKPYLKVENPNIVVLVQEGTEFRCTKPSMELSFDSTKSPSEILETLKKAAKKMLGISVTSTDLVDGGTVRVFIDKSEANDIPRYVHLKLRGNPLKVAEVETFMRSYAIDLTKPFDREINTSKAHQLIAKNHHQ